MVAAIEAVAALQTKTKGHSPVHGHAGGASVKAHGGLVEDIPLRLVDSAPINPRYESTGMERVIPPLAPLELFPSIAGHEHSVNGHAGSGWILAPLRLDLEVAFPVSRRVSSQPPRTVTKDDAEPDQRPGAKARHSSRVVAVVRQAVILLAIV